MSETDHGIRLIHEDCERCRAVVRMLHSPPPPPGPPPIKVNTSAPLCAQCSVRPADDDTGLCTPCWEGRWQDVT